MFEEYDMSEIIVAPVADTIAPAGSLADCSPEQRIELRYLNAARTLLDDAIEHKSAIILSDVLVWTLARMIVAYGTPVLAGDILRRLGEHIGTLAERRRAREEAEQAKEDGHAPH